MSDASPGIVVKRENFDEAESTFRALSRSLRRADGFTLLVAVCNTPVRQKQLLGRLDAELSEPTLLIEIEADTDDVLALVESRLNDDPVSAVMLTGLASGILSEDPIHPKLRALNHRREEWRERISCPIVFWIPEYLLQPLSQQAPDFLDWRSGTFLFLDPLGHSQISASRTADPIQGSWRLTGTERRQRMSQLREWLALESRLEPSNPARIRWLLELGEHHKRLGELDECLLVAQNEVLPALSPKAEYSRAFGWSLIADVLEARGELDEALRIRREEQLPVYERLGDVRGKAVTLGQIADVLQARGELDEALRIRREEQLPVYERLSDVRSKAVTLGQIADVLQDRGELDEALRIRREEELPIYEQLGDVREKALAQGKIADVLQVRGELDEALRIRREEELPVYEQFGDVRGKAITQGKIADVLQARGELDEALRIRREEQLPVYERLGDVRKKAITQGQIADVLQTRGELDEALRIRREEQLPVYERLGETRELLVCQANTAMILLTRNDSGDRDEAAELLRQAHAAAEKMGIPEADKIRKIQEREGF
jgi:tetratricopeptide (TPR) repeat protein